MGQVAQKSPTLNASSAARALLNAKNKGKKMSDTAVTESVASDAVAETAKIAKAPKEPKAPKPPKEPKASKYDSMSKEDLVEKIDQYNKRIAATEKKRDEAAAALAAKQ